MHLVNLQVNPKLDSITLMISELSSNSVFVDIGANIGFYSFKAAQKIKEGLVYSFEPSPREYQRLLNGINNNNFNNIIPFNFALSDINSVSKFHIAKYHTGLNRLFFNTLESSTIKLIPTFTFDLIFTKHDLKNIDLVKIDVEGAELLILNGMINCLKEKIIKKLVIEITPDFLAQFGHTKSQIYELLNSYGYKSINNLNTWQYDEIFVLS